MRCEYCDLELIGVGDARRHILTASHARKINEYELIASKHILQLRLKDTHPKDFTKLLELLNIRSSDDIDAIRKQNFFKINTKTQARISYELCNILSQSSYEYHLNKLPPHIRDRLIELVSKDFPSRIVFDK